jgi:prephenate dehydrogenase (NADP+)
MSSSSSSTAARLPAPEDATIGLIGMGEMGKMYAERLSKGGRCAK